MLDALVSIAAVRAKAGDAASVLEIVTRVLQDPATKHPTQTRAEQLRAEVAGRLSPHEIEALQMHTKSFDQVANEIMGQFE